MWNSKKQLLALSPTSSRSSESRVSAGSSLRPRSHAAALHGQRKPKALPDALVHNSLFSSLGQVHTKFHCRQAHTPGSDTSCLSFSYDGVTLASRGGEAHIFLCIVAAKHLVSRCLSLFFSVSVSLSRSLSLCSNKSSGCGSLNTEVAFLVFGDPVWSLSETNRSNSPQESFTPHFPVM